MRIALHALRIVAEVSVFALFLPVMAVLLIALRVIVWVQE